MSKNARWKPNPGQTASQLTVANRLVELDSNPFRAAERGDLPRTFIYEFLTGKKRSFSSDSIAKMAEALEMPVSELASTLAGNGNSEKDSQDPADRSLAEAAFLGLMRLFRPDIEDEPALVELFRALVAMKQDSRSTAPLVDQMFFRAQLAARRFAPK